MIITVEPPAHVPLSITQADYVGKWAHCQSVSPITYILQNHICAL